MTTVILVLIGMYVAASDPELKMKIMKESP
jgi:hypothetical protein